MPPATVYETLISSSLAVIARRVRWTGSSAMKKRAAFLSATSPPRRIVSSNRSTFAIRPQPLGRSFLLALQEGLHALVFVFRVEADRLTQRIERLEHRVR